MARFSKAIVAHGIKRCSMCGQSKSFSEYGTQAGGKYLRSYCKLCDSRRARSFDRTKHRLATHKYRNKHRSLGICPACTRPAAPGVIHCLYHLKKIADESYQRRGIFSLRKPDTEAKKRREAIERVRREIGKAHWTTEIAKFVTEHVDVFLDSIDNALDKSLFFGDMTDLWERYAKHDSFVEEMVSPGQESGRADQRISSAEAQEAA